MRVKSLTNQSFPDFSRRFDGFDVPEGNDVGVVGEILHGALCLLFPLDRPQGLAQSKPVLRPTKQEEDIFLSKLLNVVDPQVYKIDDTDLELMGWIDRCKCKTLTEGKYCSSNRCGCRKHNRSCTVLCGCKDHNCAIE